MVYNTVSIKARLCLLPTNNGGRSGPIFGLGSYRPNHNFGGESMYIGFIEMAEGFYLEPGDCAEVRVDFLTRYPELLKELYVGREWYVQEGARVVGIGTVLELLYG